MSCSCSFTTLFIPKALPSLSPSPSSPSKFSLSIISNQLNIKLHKKLGKIRQATDDLLAANNNKSSLIVQVAALWTIFENPALAVTGVNYEPDLKVVLIKVGLIAFWYFLIMPPIIMNWLRIRWYKRKLLEMYLQFMCVFLFFPGLLIWAPFLNFRKFPRDPSMKYPWDKPKDPSLIKFDYRKWPYAEPDDYS